MAWFNWWTTENVSAKAEQYPEIREGESFDLGGQSVLVLQMESTNTQILPDADEEEWKSLNDVAEERARVVQKVRYLCRKHPNLKRALFLYSMYVIGKGMQVYLKPDVPEEEMDTEEARKRANLVKFQSAKAWRRFLQSNHGSWSVKEWYKRLIREGDAFTRRIVLEEWPMQVRFIDSENIDDGGGDSGTKGIITDPDDVTIPIQYQLWDIELGEVVELIPAEVMHHAKIDCDSNEKRGRSRFESIIDTAVMLSAMVRNEVTHRNAQSSIVLVRKVAGTKSDASSIVNNAQTGTTNRTDGSATSREKWRPGTILTVSKSVDVEFKQPQSNFSDATPLIKLLLLQLSAATGWSYSQLTADASEGNFASALVAESPVYQMVEDEREFVAASLERIAMWVFTAAAQYGAIENMTQQELEDDWRVTFDFQSIVTREPVKEAQAANLGVMAGALSKREMARRMQADPAVMAREIEDELQRQAEQMGEMGVANTGMQNMNPTMQDKQASVDGNAAGGGTNQDNGTTPAGHIDKVV